MAASDDTREEPDLADLARRCARLNKNGLSFVSGWVGGGVFRAFLDELKTALDSAEAHDLVQKPRADRSRARKTAMLAIEQARKARG